MKCGRPAIAVLAVASMGVPARAQMTLIEDERSYGYSARAEGTGGDSISGTRYPSPRGVFAYWSDELQTGASSFPASTGIEIDVRSLPTTSKFDAECMMHVGAGVQDTGGAYCGFARGSASSLQRITFSIDQERVARVYGSVTITGSSSTASIILRRLSPDPIVLASDVAPTSSSFDYEFDLVPGEYEVRLASSASAYFYSDCEPGALGGGEFSTASYAILLEYVCKADFDGSGELDVFDFLEFQATFVRGDIRADFDGDGTLTIFDFLAFANAFQDGCD